jgi:hypothetical protein
LLKITNGIILQKNFEMSLPSFEPISLVTEQHAISLSILQKEKERCKMHVPEI